LICVHFEDSWLVSQSIQEVHCGIDLVCFEVQLKYFLSVSEDQPVNFAAFDWVLEIEG